MIAKVIKSICRRLWQAWAWVWQYRTKGLGSRAANSMRGVQAGLASAWTASTAHLCAPVMRAEPLERPCQSLPKPSAFWESLRERGELRCLCAESSGICTQTRHLLCHAQPPPSRRLRLRPLASPSPPLAVCLPSSSVCRRRRRARIAGRMRLIGNSRRGQSRVVAKNLSMSDR